jgi:hypothetical protein
MGIQIDCDTRFRGLLSEGDFLVYCDSASYFVDRMDPLIELATRTRQQVIPFELALLERCYTKRDAFIVMGCDAARFTETRQRLGSLILLQKSAFAEAFDRLVSRPGAGSAVD